MLTMRNLNLISVQSWAYLIHLVTNATNKFEYFRVLFQMEFSYIILLIFKMLLIGLLAA